jgi:hypothetical protein
MQAAFSPSLQPSHLDGSTNVGIACPPTGNYGLRILEHACAESKKLSTLCQGNIPPYTARYDFSCEGKRFRLGNPEPERFTGIMLLPYKFQYQVAASMRRLAGVSHFHE